LSRVWAISSRLTANFGYDGQMANLLELTGPLAQWLHHWGYLAVFGGVMLENAGVPMPGETTILIATALAAHGELKVAIIYPVAVAGAITGDNLGYCLGRWLGPRALHRMAKLARIDPQKLIEVEEQFRKNAAWAVFFGRFVALLRTLAGPMAGAVAMPWRKFFLFNSLGALVWVGVIVTLGYTFGAQIGIVLQHAGLAFLLLALAVGGWFGFKAWRESANKTT
jgi:membrane protein DedA with SNARE-associated domain